MSERSTAVRTCTLNEQREITVKRKTTTTAVTTPATTMGAKMVLSVELAS
jgi:hypothetical protein